MGLLNGVKNYNLTVGPSECYFFCDVILNQVGFQAGNDDSLQPVIRGL